MFTFVIGGYSAAPWVPARASDVTRFIEAGEILPTDVVVDLGCGDGRLLFAAMRAGAAEAIGYEISLLPYLIAQVRCLFTPRNIRPKIYFRNFWKADVSRTTVVYTFLMPKSFDHLLKKINELPNGARLINYVWELPGMTPEKIFEAPKSLKLYRYRLQTAPTIPATAPLN